MPTDSLRVPKVQQPFHGRIVALTDDVCSDRLGPEYRDLARRMVAALCRKRPSPVVSGQPRTWAAGVVYALGQISFLSDRSTEPYMASADLAVAFAVGQSTMQAKANVIREALDANRMSMEWLLPSMAADHPLA